MTSCARSSTKSVRRLIWPISRRRPLSNQSPLSLITFLSLHFQTSRRARTEGDQQARRTSATRSRNSRIAWEGAPKDVLQLVGLVFEKKIIEKNFYKQISDDVRKKMWFTVKNRKKNFFKLTFIHEASEKVLFFHEIVPKQWTFHQNNFLNFLKFGIMSWIVKINVFIIFLFWTIRNIFFLFETEFQFFSKFGWFSSEFWISHSFPYSPCPFPLESPSFPRFWTLFAPLPSVSNCQNGLVWKGRDGGSVSGLFCHSNWHLTGPTQYSSLLLHKWSRANCHLLWFIGVTHCFMGWVRAAEKEIEN